MAANYVLLASQTVGAVSASSVTFSNIPQTGYTDLKIVGSTRCDGASAQLIAKFNGSTTGYSRKLVYGDGSTVNSSGGSAEAHVRFAFSETSSQTASTFNSFDLYIPNYTTANYKSLSADSVSENNATGAEAGLHAGLWASTAAITSINISDVSATNFVQYSSFYLYGLAASGVTPVIAPFATGGNVTNDGTYWYHSFLASGTFTPLKTLSCDYLVVAGGAGGGGDAGGRAAGGGGAGGYRTATGQTLTGSLAVTVGAGGGGGNGAAGDRGSAGGDSVFNATTSTGGGGGAAHVTSSGISGGSGGGGNAPAGTAGTSSPVTSPVQGYAGGVGGPAATNYTGGGGGGATAVGAAGVAAVGGVGGAGSNAHSTWASATSTGVSGYYAGGGGGGSYNGGTAGAGGAGGGGAGTLGVGTNATTNTGSGGGGAGCPPASNPNSNGGNGGSGIVIIRYAMV